MPFKAIDESGNRRVSYELTPEQYRQHWTCPNCDQSMLFVDAQLKRKHFRHQVESHCEPEPETEEHLFLKEWVHTWLANAGYKCEYEVKIGNRQADVTFTTNNRKLRVVECQVSPITPQEIFERNRDYLGNHVEDIFWVLHPLNFLGFYQEYTKYAAYRLKDVEREFMDSPEFLYFDPADKQVKKYFFKAKWMRGGSGGICTSLFLKMAEKTVEAKYLPNLALLQHWIAGRKREFKVIRDDD